MSERQLPSQTEGKEFPPAPRDPNVIISWFKELVRQAQLAWRLFLDPRVPWPSKIIPPAVLIYILSPIDIIPDPGLGLGQLDDLAVLLLGIKLFIELAPAEIVREHLRALGAKISEWKVTEDEPSVVEGEIVTEEEDYEEDTDEVVAEEEDSEEEPIEVVAEEEEAE